MKQIILILIVLLIALACAQGNEKTKLSIGKDFSFDWKAANVYFLLTDRFNNGDTLNDVNFERNKKTGLLRGFEGGDLKGITQKIESGYFTDLGVNAIWMTPIVEQIHGGTDEGTGLTYGYHGYWTKDWTMIDPNYGTAEDLRQLVETAHSRGIRILLDAVINHTGPVTEKDPVWPSSWVRTGPKCKFDSYESTISCTLVKNLPDIKTESNDDVILPPQLVEKWKAEGRYDQEVSELDTFFKRTGYPRAPRFYIMKWLTDYITDFGIDGYRVDTVKHTEEYVWQEFKTECDYSFEKWKQNNPNAVLDDNAFYLVGEVYGYNISSGRMYDFGDKKVDYFDDAFSALINFEFKWNSKEQDYEAIFKRYSKLLNTKLNGFGTLNYLSSHDDAQPFDPDREKSKEAANKLLLSPGASQIYYGDESNRLLKVEDAVGDANLRSNMNWDDINQEAESLRHWQKLGQFRSKHPAIGAGKHELFSKNPYVFSRTYIKNDKLDFVMVGLGMNEGNKTLDVSSQFDDGTILKDAYSNQTAEVKNGKVVFNSAYDIVLLEKN